MLLRRSTTLFLFLGALALLTTGSHAQGDFELIDISENEFLGLEELDAGPSSGPFSNKPGWPNLDGPTDQTNQSDGPKMTPAPTPAPTLAPTPTPTSTTGAVPTPTTAAPGQGQGHNEMPPSPSPSPTGIGGASTPAPTPVPTPSMAPSTPQTQHQSTGATPAPTTVKPATTTTPTHPSGTAGQAADASDRSECSKDSILASVEGKGSYCVSATETICSGANAKGKCPGKQSGLEHGSHCGVVKSGVFGCLPGAGPKRCDVDDD